MLYYKYIIKIGQALKKQVNVEKFRKTHDFLILYREI